MAALTRFWERLQAFNEYSCTCFQLTMFCAMYGDKGRSLISSPSGYPAAWPNQRSLLWTSLVGIHERGRRCPSPVVDSQFLHIMCHSVTVKDRWLLVLATSRIRRAGSNALLSGGPCLACKQLSFLPWPKTRLENGQNKHCFLSLGCPGILRWTSSRSIKHYKFPKKAHGQAEQFVSAHHGRVLTLPWSSML